MLWLVGGSFSNDFSASQPERRGWFFDWIRHPTDDAYWRHWAPNAHYGQMNSPVLYMEGRYDAFRRRPATASHHRTARGLRPHGR